MKADLPFNRFAVIPTKGDRVDNLGILIKRLVSEDIQPIVVDTSDGYTVSASEVGDHAMIVAAPPGPVNISAWWNLGLAVARRWSVVGQGMGYQPEYNVAILNDDCLPNFRWFDQVSEAMRRDGSHAACSGAAGHKLTEPGPVNLWYRMTGWAFMLRGESDENWPNESFRWYFSDDHIDWAARKAGGMTMVPIGPVPHFNANEHMTPEMHVMSGEDRQRFLDFWGKTPW